MHTFITHTYSTQGVQKPLTSTTTQLQGPIHTRFTALHPSGVVNATALPRFVPFTLTTVPPVVLPLSADTDSTTPAVYQYDIVLDSTVDPMTRTWILTMP